MRVMVAFSIGKYRDKVLCDIVPMHVGHILFGSPWQDDRKVQHNGFRNLYSFLMEGRVISLTLLSPRKAYEDQLKIKRECGQSSRDESPKERVERVAYCSKQPLMELEPNVSFQQQTEDDFPKPFYNMKAKIQGRILFKRRGMMQSEVLYKVRSHGRVAEELYVGGRSKICKPG